MDTVNKIHVVTGRIIVRHSVNTNQISLVFHSFVEECNNFRLFPVIKFNLINTPTQRVLGPGRVVCRLALPTPTQD